MKPKKQKTQQNKANVMIRLVVFAQILKKKKQKTEQNKKKNTFPWEQGKSRDAEINSGSKETFINDFLNTVQISLILYLLKTRFPV